MIRNILFDMGNVLIHFDRDLFISQLGVSPEDGQLLKREVFLSVEWVQMDRGTLTDEEAAKQICKRLPSHLHDAVEQLVLKWDDPILPVEGMYELVKELKDAGYGLYLLSNASFRQHAYWTRIPCSIFFDGTIISSDEGVMKPRADYFLRALQKFGLNASECFFVDDLPANVEGAHFCGISGAVFHTDVQLLRHQLRAAGVNVAESI